MKRGKSYRQDPDRVGARPPIEHTAAEFVRLGLELQMVESVDESDIYRLHDPSGYVNAYLGASQFARALALVRAGCTKTVERTPTQTIMTWRWNRSGRGVNL